MSLTKFELKKIICSPIVMAALVGLLLLNLYSLLFGSQDGYKAYRSPFDTDIVRLQENGSYFAGEINDEWYQKHLAEHQKIVDDPANQVSEDEKERIRQDYLMRGYLYKIIFDLLAIEYESDPEKIKKILAGENS